MAFTMRWFLEAVHLVKHPCPEETAHLARMQEDTERRKQELRELQAEKKYDRFDSNEGPY